MMCRYRAGDALVQLVNFIVLLALSLRLGLKEHWAWFIAPALLLLTMLVAALMNSRSRKEDEVKQLRAQHQISLGVPPDEV